MNMTGAIGSVIENPRNSSTFRARFVACRTMPFLITRMANQAGVGGPPHQVGSPVPTPTWPWNTACQPGSATGTRTSSRPRRDRPGEPPERRFHGRTRSELRRRTGGEVGATESRTRPRTPNLEPTARHSGRRDRGVPGTAGPPYLTTTRGAPTFLARDAAEVDRRAVDAVLETERSLDREPQEMPHNNEGYDMVSRDPEEFAL